MVTDSSGNVIQGPPTTGSWWKRCVKNVCFCEIQIATSKDNEANKEYQFLVGESAGSQLFNFDFQKVKEEIDKLNEVFKTKLFYILVSLIILTALYTIKGSLYKMIQDGEKIAKMDDVIAFLLAALLSVRFIISPTAEDKHLYSVIAFVSMTLVINQIFTYLASLASRKFLNEKLSDKNGLFVKIGSFLTGLSIVYFDLEFLFPYLILAWIAVKVVSRVKVDNRPSAANEITEKVEDDQYKDPFQ